jgi:hypothetical protein
MNISTNKDKLGVNRQNPSSAVIHNMLGIIRWLIGFFALTEEDRLKAGIRGRRRA